MWSQKEFSQPGWMRHVQQLFPKQKVVKHKDSSSSLLASILDGCIWRGRSLSIKSSSAWNSCPVRAEHKKAHGSAFWERPQCWSNVESWGIFYGVEIHVVVNICDHMSYSSQTRMLLLTHTTLEKTGKTNWNLEHFQFNCSIAKSYLSNNPIKLYSDVSYSGVYFWNTSSVNRWTLPFVVLAFVDLTRKDFIQPKNTSRSQSVLPELSSPIVEVLYPSSNNSWKNTKSLQCALTEIKSNSSKWFRCWAW